jgi:hypothetical protein
MGATPVSPFSPRQRGEGAPEGRMRGLFYSLFAIHTLPHSLTNDKNPWRPKAVTGSCEIIVKKTLPFAFGRPGSDLLSQVLRHSTIGAEAFNDRVRDGIGFGHPAIATRPAKGEKECCTRTVGPQKTPRAAPSQKGAGPISLAARPDGHWQ